MIPLRRLAIVRFLIALAACVAVAPASAQVVLEELSDLPALEQPVGLYVPPDSDRFFVVEQPGRITSFDADAPADASVFLDLTDRVNTQVSWEEGLLGLAFHPDYPENGHFFVHYTTFPAEQGENHRTIIARFTRSAEDPLRADPASERVLLDLEQLGRFHNGGQLAFGPDGYLYASLGDGDGSGERDPSNAAQDPTNLFGTILRLDVDDVAEDKTYRIPDDNPFVGNAEGWREEIWAYGLRNPWRFSFDPATGWLWVGDVGAGTKEEVSVVREGGANLGWDVVEGTHCWGPDAAGEPDCDAPGLLAPVWTYWKPGGNAITGGYVYHGAAAPDLEGKYVFGDFISGEIWALTVEEGGTPAVEELPTYPLVSSFGVDADGELYVLSLTGRIARFTEGAAPEEPAPPAARVLLDLAGPNPFRGSTRLVAEASGPARLVLYDALGREVEVLLDGHLAAGAPRSVEIDARRLAAGTYFCRLEAEGASAVQTLTVVR
jgi:glucose/arabinose dehydrogenase